MRAENRRRQYFKKSQEMRGDLALGHANYGTPIRRRNEPDEFFNPVKRPRDPHERQPKRQQPSVPQFKFLSD